MRSIKRAGRNVSLSSTDGTPEFNRSRALALRSSAADGAILPTPRKSRVVYAGHFAAEAAGRQRDWPSDRAQPSICHRLYFESGLERPAVFRAIGWTPL
jgi:hypothetical protein